MGLFDLFGRDPKTKDERSNLSEFDSRVNYNPPKTAPMAICAPKSYAEVEQAIDDLKNGKTVMLHLTEVKPETAVRILDMLNGAVYALGGGVYEMQPNIYMYSPSGVEVRKPN